MTASMNYELNNVDKINRYLDDCKSMKIKILKPCINNSKTFFSIETRNNVKCIRYALSAIKNVGISSTNEIVKVRNKKGAFNSINHFCGRLSDENFNIRQLEYLIKSGSFDTIENNRAKLFNNTNKIVQIIRTNNSKSNSNQNDLFSNKIDVNFINLTSCSDWGKAIKSKYEYEALGFYLSEHPLSEFKDFLSNNGCVDLDEIKKNFIDEKNDKKLFYKIAALPMEKNERVSKKGNKYAYVKFSDNTDNFEAIVFSDILSNSSNLLEQTEALILDLEVEKKDDNLNFRVTGLMTLKDFIKGLNKTIKLSVDEENNLEDLKKHLMKFKDKDGSNLELEVKVKNKILNFNIPGKFNYFELQNNKLKGITLVN